MRSSEGQGSVSRVYLSLGSNLGNRRFQLKEALRRLRGTVQIENISSLYETEPVDYVDQPPFLNIVCQVRTELEPHELLSVVKDIEHDMGRASTFRNAPRPIDIDILFFDDRVVRTPSLVIPHPRLVDRAFVLIPLQEIAPCLVHPSLNKPVSQLARQVDRNKWVRRVPGGLDVPALC